MKTSLRAGFPTRGGQGGAGPSTQGRQVEASIQQGESRQPGPNPEAVGLLERFGAQMLATARRYSESPQDAEDALQRATEILLTHRPSGTDEEVCRWLRTTTKHEALAINRHRARVVPIAESESLPDLAGGAGDAHDQAERLERLHHGAQALRRLKPQEVRCLLLKAEGYSYDEICEITGFTYTKVNRCLTEGRRSFLERVTGIETGEECERLAPQLSVLADGEASAEDLAALRPHLRTCLSCRARLREFRAVPSRVAALAPVAAAGDGGQLRGMLESLVGATQDKAAALGERAHSAAELATGQKVAAVAASAAALAGGGATVERLHERDGNSAAPPAEVRKIKEEVKAPAPAAPVAVPKPVLAPAPAPVAKAPAPRPPPAATTPAPPPPPSPATEFAPAAAPSAVPPPPAPAAPAGGGGGSGEFGP